MTPDQAVFTVYEARRAAAVQPWTKATMFSRITPSEAWWKGEFDFDQRSREGNIVRRSVLANIHAIGNDLDFATPRRIEALITSKDTRHPFSLMYLVEETPDGIEYRITAFTGRKIIRPFVGFVGGKYKYIEKMDHPNQPLTTARLFLDPEDVEGVYRNQDFTGGLLVASGATFLPNTI